MTPSQVLLIAAGAMYVVLGVAHGLLTMRTVRRPTVLGAFSPTSDGAEALMRRSAVGISPSANLWKAWIGFNFSHSLGVVVFGALAIGAAQAPVAFDGRLLPRGLVIAAALAYVVMAKLFWFRDPLIGTAVAAALVVGALAIA
jgi:hypothetical protein